MPHSQAHVQTTKASRYLVQLCKHFAHKIEVEYDTQKGHATFPWGTCTMQAEENQLILQCMGADEAGLERVQDVVKTHLEGFAFREKPSIVWER
ncbi:DUF2218 domain-containing protein [Microvirga sp. ACRRW]|uniref:DUF2218 domain-containing protein n=1 Tax=Microvirga sp. ACRRW TaxID=2918205 RepID=UPI001EF5D9CD|nr:DUF2218 domain-containing protein [Microvirga sp. ACRRW]MCG7392847.1 DUF2218 domain-containing protein [Microvirga sp. ACRRW]